jgi:hypothetical protein
MNASEFRQNCLDIIDPFYPDASAWLDRNWAAVVDAVKKHSGRGILAALTACVNRTPERGKLDFFFQDIARYLPRDDIGSGLVEGESTSAYFARMGLAGSMARPLPKLELTPAEEDENLRLLAELKRKCPPQVPS